MKGYEYVGRKLKCFTEKESFQFILENSGVVSKENVDRKTLP